MNIILISFAQRAAGQTTLRSRKRIFWPSSLPKSFVMQEGEVKREQFIIEMKVKKVINSEATVMLNMIFLYYFFFRIL